MNIFSKNITETIWKTHLKEYSSTLDGHDDSYKSVLPIQYHNLSFNDLYICPLCAKNFFVQTDHGIQGNSEFSLDHLPPDSVGGKFKILTCKKCNNDSGVFEAELKKLMNFGNDEKDSSAVLIKKVKIKAKEGNYSIQADLRNKNKVTDILLNENAKKHNEEYIKFIEHLNSGKIKELEFEISAFNRNKLEKALLKSAYLICFIFFGYEFVFSENASRIREVLDDKAIYPIKVPLSWSKPNEMPKGLSLLSLDNKRLAFLCGIELKGKTHTYIANVLIPNPTQEGWNLLKDTRNLVEGKSRISFNTTTLPRIKHARSYTMSWNIALPQSITTSPNIG